jgi:hypothetical protein
MRENESLKYVNDDGTEFTPGLHPTPDLCVSCVTNEMHDAEEEVLCNLTRADQQSDEVFVCFAYQPISPTIDREDVLRELCKRARVEYPEQPAEMDENDAGPVRF